MNAHMLAGIGAISVLAAGAALGAEAGPVDLATPGWEIVIAADAPPAVVYAAEEFRDLLKQASGKELPIRKADGAGDVGAPARKVYIGDSPVMRASPAGFSVEGLGPEDLRIVAHDDFIAIAGGGPRGTLYGVYSFFEDYLGVRFLTANHTHVPRLSGKSQVGPIDRTYRPPLSFRWPYYGENNLNPRFAARLRCNTVDGDPKYGGKTGQSLINHSFGNQIPLAKYGKEHPEYFALRDGKRLAEGTNDFFTTEPCLTHPDVLKIVTDAVLAELKASPHRENISVSQNDNDKHCLCPNCKAIDDREGTPMGTLLEFVNAIADVVAKEHPGVKVGTLSYWYTRKPPKTLKPRPTVQIQLCSIECCVIHPINDPKCEKNVQFCSDMAEWGQLTQEIFIWNYNTNFSNYLLPFPNLRVIEPNVRYFMKNGAKGIFMQAAGNTTGAELSDLRNYVIAGLLWDPTRSGEKLRDEFLGLHYGKAAAPIRRFIEMYHDHCEAKGIHRNCFGRAADYAIDEKIAQAALDAFAEALSLAGDDAVKARVEQASICAYRAAVDPAWELEQGKTLDSTQAARLRPLVRRLFELCERYQVPRFSEGMTTGQAKAKLQAAFGLKADEAF
ncbi:MAG: hypothetical protein AMXMBFR13_16290 [Phycisphaerae bacterium]